MQYLHAERINRQVLFSERGQLQVWHVWSVIAASPMHNIYNASVNGLYEIKSYLWIAGDRSQKFWITVFAKIKSGKNSGMQGVQVYLVRYELTTWPAPVGLLAPLVGISSGIAEPGHDFETSKCLVQALFSQLINLNSQLRLWQYCLIYNLLWGAVQGTRNAPLYPEELLLGFIHNAIHTRIVGDNYAKKGSHAGWLQPFSNSD